MLTGVSPACIEITLEFLSPGQRRGSRISVSFVANIVILDAFLTKEQSVKIWQVVRSDINL